MGDYIDELNNVMPAPGNGRPKRARIDKEGNFVAGKDVYGYNTAVRPAVRYNINTNSSAAASVLAFGADNTGVVDSSAAFAAALAAYCTVFVPAGVYRFNSPLVIPVSKTLQGLCAQSTFLHFYDSAVNTIAITVSSNAALERVRLKNLGTNTTTSTAISIPAGAGARSIFQVNMFDDTLNYFNKGIVVADSSTVFIRECIIWSNSTALSITGTSQRIHSVNNLLVAEDTVGPGVLIEAATTESVFFTGCNVNATAGVAYQLDGNATIIAGRLDAATDFAGAGIATSEILGDAYVSSFKSGFQIAGGPTISAGAGAPGGTPPNGSVYFRTDAANADQALYMRIGGAWVALDGAP